jgi:hypothetical protein
MNSIQIVKVVNGKRQEASIEDRYLEHFKRDGWEVKGEESQETIEAMGGVEAGRRSDSDVGHEPEDKSDEDRDNDLNTIDSMDDKDAIVKFVEQNYGESVDKRGSVETVKEKAKAVINESERVD